MFLKGTQAQTLGDGKGHCSYHSGSGRPPDWFPDAHGPDAARHLEENPLTHCRNRNVGFKPVILSLTERLLGVQLNLRSNWARDTCFSEYEREVAGSE